MILRLTEPEVLRHPALASWLDAVCTKLERPHAPAYIIDLCAKPDTLVLLGIEAQKPRALLVLQPPSPLTLYPIITLGYNSGSALLGKSMMDAAATWCGQQGSAFCHAVNGSGASDAAYERCGRRCGWSVVDRQTFITFAVPQELNDGPAVDTRTRLGLPAT